MDYSVTPGLNNGKPFVKFYTFSPSGKLLLSVSLDGRREKFMPGVCVNCHGGDIYGGKFPDDYGPTSSTNSTGTGQANLGSFFLPFDIANLNYSTSDPARSRKALLKPLRQMNELLASFTPSTPSDPIRPITNDVRTLIMTRWYPPANPANTDNEQTFPTPSNYEQFGKTNALGQPTVGQQFPGNGTTSCIVCHDAENASPNGPHDSTAKYVSVIAPGCQVCHASNAGVKDNLAGDLRPDLGGGLPRITFFGRPPAHYLVPLGRGSHPVCGGNQDLRVNHTMPNSLSAFERFWQVGSIQPTSLFALAPPKSGPQPGACTSLSPHPDL
jgi:mono/diheme cytochrome c family protein